MRSIDAITGTSPRCRIWRRCKTCRIRRRRVFEQAASRPAPSRERKAPHRHAGGFCDREWAGRQSASADRRGEGGGSTTSRVAAEGSSLTAEISRACCTLASSGKPEGIFTATGFGGWPKGQPQWRLSCLGSGRRRGLGPPGRSKSKHRETDDQHSPGRWFRHRRRIGEVVERIVARSIRKNECDGCDRSRRAERKTGKRVRADDAFGNRLREG